MTHPTHATHDPASGAQPLAWLRRLLPLLLLSLGLGAAAASPEEVGVGALLHDATLRGLNGPDQKLSSFRGKPLIINVWASWCPPCIREMGSLERLAWSDLGQQFTVIGISTDDYPQAAKAMLAKTQATLNHYIDQRLQMEKMLGASHLPLTVLVDAQGRVRKKIVGAREWDDLTSQQLISQTLGLRPPAAIGPRPGRP